MGANCSTCRITSKDNEMILYFDSEGQKESGEASVADLGGARAAAKEKWHDSEIEKKVIKIQANVKRFFIQEVMRKGALRTLTSNRNTNEGVNHQEENTLQTLPTRGEEGEFPSNILQNQDRLQDESQIIMDYLQRRVTQLGISREETLNIQNNTIHLNNNQLTLSISPSHAPRLTPFEIEQKEMEILNDNASKYTHNDFKTEKTDQSVDMVNYFFTQEKFAQSCESFFIRNSYEYPHKSLTIGADEKFTQNNFQNNNNPFSTEPSVNKSKVIKTIKKIIKTPISKTNSENIKNEIKKSMIIFNLISKKHQKVCLLALKNYFHLWKHFAKINNFRSLSINKLKQTKTQTIRRIVKKLLIKYIQTSFYSWYKKVIAIKNRIQIGSAVLRKIIIFKDKNSFGNDFKNWAHKTKIISEQSYHQKLKETLFCKIIDKFFRMSFNVIVQSRFKYWRGMSFKLKDDMIYTLALMKLSKILKNSVNYIVINSLKNEYHRIKLYNLRTDKISIFYYQKQRSDISVLKKKFYKWMEEFNVKQKKFNVIEQLSILIKTSENLKSIINKVYFKRFLKNLKRKSEWEKPLSNKASTNSLTTRSKYVKYFLINGKEVELDKVNIIKNYLWKFAKPVNYYFKKLQVIVNKLKHKELEAKSKKWQIIEKE